MTTKEQVERLDFWAVRHQWINSPTETNWVRYSDYAALLARAEAARIEIVRLRRTAGETNQPGE